MLCLKADVTRRAVEGSHTAKVQGFSLTLASVTGGEASCCAPFFAPLWPISL